MVARHQGGYTSKGDMLLGGQSHKQVALLQWRV